LKGSDAYGSVRAVPRRAPTRIPLAERRRLARQRRARRVGALVVLALVLLVTLVLTAFGSSPQRVRASIPAPAERLLPAGPPRPQVVATVAGLHLQLPVSQPRVTAVGYHAAPDSALPLRPAGSRGNRSFVARLWHRIAGGGTGGPRWYQLPGDGRGAPTSVLDVGASPGTDVYSPVDATVVGIDTYVLDGRRRGVQLDLQPVDSPSLVVSVTRLRADPALTVGDSLQAGTSRLGTVLDLSGVEQQELARYTQDAGNHVSIEAHSGASLLP
jgi:hypothetical protein